MIRKAAISIIVFAICLLTVGSGADDQPEKRVMNFLAVMDLKCGEGIKKEQCAFLTNVVIDALVKSKKYTVIDRANRDKILGEAGFQMSACVDESCTVEAGRILGVGKIITGSVDLIDKTYFLNIQLINVETAAVEASATKLCECDFKELTDTIRYAARNLVAEPQVHLPATTTPSGAKGGEMVCVPAGEFMMGSDNGNSDEKPIHRVYLDEFYIDKYEVTNAQYNKCVSAGACGQNTKYDGFTDPQQPVVGVTWHQADTYCKWVGKRLPTEAEWEKALIVQRRIITNADIRRQSRWGRIHSVPALMEPWTWRETYGSGAPTGMMKSITARIRTVIRRGLLRVSIMFFTAGRGTPIRTFCDHRTAPGTIPTT